MSMFLEPPAQAVQHQGDFALSHDGVVSLSISMGGSDCHRKTKAVQPSERPAEPGGEAICSGSLGLKRGPSCGSLGNASNASGTKSNASNSLVLSESKSEKSTPSQCSEKLRARNQPRLSRCDSRLSSLSEKTATKSEKSSVPPEVEIGGLRGFHSVSFTTQWSFNNDYDYGDKLGEGGFGQVWHCQHRETLQHFAVKVIPAETIKDVQRFEREHKVFERLTHPHVVHLHEIFMGLGDVYLVMDLCLGGDLMDYTIGYWTDRAHPERTVQVLDDPRVGMGLPWREGARMTWQMLAAIAYLHHHRFCHRDVKLENFMIREADVLPHLQLCDFGLAVRYEKGGTLTGRVGTLMYMAPEVVRNEDYCEKVDIWSIGVCSFVINSLIDPWGTQSDKEEVIERIGLNQRELLPDHKPKELRTLIDSMMVKSSSERPSAKELFRSSKWLRKHGPSTSQSSCVIV